MRYFFDTEFIEDGRTIDLVSIGIVADDGREYYGISSQARLDLANDWVRAHVLPALPGYGDPAWKSKSTIATDVLEFIGSDPDPEFWAYYGDYDWVVFCQLFGTMMHLPYRFPQFCMDLKQLSMSVGSPRHPSQDPSKSHNALEDARWNKQLFELLVTHPGC